MRRAFRLGLGQDHLASEVDDELAFHVEMRSRKLMAMGLDADAARREALRQFGDLQHVRASCVTLDEGRERSMKRTRYADELRQDTGFAVRALRRNPAFTAVAVFTLALGIGANTAIFTLINAILLRPIPVVAPEHLVALGTPSRINSMSHGTPQAGLYSYQLYRDVRGTNRLMTGLLASGRTDRLDVRADAHGAEVEHPAGRFVSGNYFAVLGIPAARGRAFGALEDSIAGASPVAVISDRYWTRRFARDQQVVGKTLVVDNVMLTVIGVTPPGFSGEIVDRPTDLWIPITMQPMLQPHLPQLDDRHVSWLLLLGRLAHGVTVADAVAGFPALVHRELIEHLQPPDDTASAKDQEVPVTSGATGFSRVRTAYGAPLFTMMAGVGLLLFIVCANVANLLLAKAVARTSEFNVRLAMGAGRARLLRQLMTESAVLASLSAVAGLAMAWAGGRLLVSLVVDGGGAPVNVQLDVRVLAFTLGLSLLAVMLFGLLPAVRASRLDLAANLRARGVTGGLGARGQRFPVGKLMIAGQIALSLVLLMGATLLVQSLRNLESTDAGLDRDHILMLSIDSRARGYSGATLAELTRSLTGRLSSLPGVRVVTYSENGVFSGTESNSMVLMPGWHGRTAEDSASASDQVGPQYAAGLGARVVEGRDFTDQDAVPGGRRVALVNQSFARFYFGSASAIGRSFRLDHTTSVEIVGVIGDVKDHHLDGEVSRRFYTAYNQQLNGTPAEVNFEIRTTGDPARLVAAARAAVLAQDPLLAIDADQPLAASMRGSIAQQRLLAQVATGFGSLALLLAAIGLYGVMTYAVTRRTGEIGLRIALGAAPNSMIGMVLRDALGLVGIGVAAGIPLAWLATRLLGTQLHGVSPADPAAALVAVMVLTAAAAVAAIVPARRASRVSALSALNHQ
jgi:predicted permease